jgi:hypothetical protein
LRGKDAKWNMIDEGEFEGLDREMGRAMSHTQKIFSMHRLNNTAWSKSIVRATRAVWYWDVISKRNGAWEAHDIVLKYYIS